MIDIFRSPLFWIIVLLACVSPALLFGMAKAIIVIIGIIALAIILLLVYFSFKFKSINSQIEDQMRNGGTNQNSRQNPFNFGGRAQSQQEGDVKVYATRDSQEKKVNKNVGDYVDFEEIKK